MDGRVRKFVEHELYNYPKYRRELRELQNDMYAMKTPVYDGMPHSHTISDPTAKAVIKYHSSAYIRRIEGVCEDIEYILSGVPTEKQNMVKLLYWDRSHTTQGVALVTPATVRTIQRWNYKLLKDIAIQMGLI